MSDAWELAGVIAGTLIAVFTLTGLIVKYSLLPYLRAELAKRVEEPLQQISHQVTANGGTSDPPTVLDKIHDVQMEVREVKLETLFLSRMFDGHLTWSQQEVDQMNRRINAVERTQQRREQGK